MKKEIGWFIICFLIGAALAMAGYNLFDHGHLSLKNTILMITIDIIAYILFWKNEPPK